MSNTFFASQPVDPDAADRPGDRAAAAGHGGQGSGGSLAGISPLIADVEQGIYLRMAESGMEDPAGWGIQVTAHYGEEIRNGRLTGRFFAPVGITGYVQTCSRASRPLAVTLSYPPVTAARATKKWCLSPQAVHTCA